MDNFVQSIIQNCEKRGLTVSKDMVIFLIDLHKLNPECITMEQNNVKSVNKIIRIITEKLTSQNRPSLITLKMQLYFMKHYGTRAAIIKKHRQRLERKSQWLVNEICDVKRIITERDSEKLYEKIIVIITLVSRLGNAMDTSVFRETSVALQSVYGQMELNHFVTLSSAEKKSKLAQLVKIVAGIRLFNKDCHRGGAGIDDLPQILHEAIEKSHQSILDFLQNIMKKVYQFTAGIETIVFTCSSSPKSSLLNNNNINNPTDYACWAIEMLTAYRQQEIFIRKLLANVEFSENQMKSFVVRFKSRLLKIHATVRYRTAIPTIQIYPQFIDLADIWLSLQSEVIILSHINNLACQIKALAMKNFHTHDTINQLEIDRFTRSTNIPSDAERLERSMGKLITECGECLIYYPNSTKNFEKIQLEFLGFCAWSFVAGSGALIPGNPNIGVVMWRGKYFAFSSNDAAKKFGDDPNRFLYEAIDFIRRHPEYIHLFQIQEDIKNMNNGNEFLDTEHTLKKQQNQTCQTDVHCFTPIISPKYHHSIWKYKKKALKLANVLDCVTKSTQTSICHFKRSRKIQASELKTISIQTYKHH
ncbi:cilia- and flagella-associated protein 206 [Diachasma alloeum]|uniref:cilia- and flagella-associated protein 206 n=1 Tax=Diachasma alloeum TaxID=454923 RepID=UPI000738171F|nr:cilia- and flagella-associated protein 206 [Diachasma alloeum]